MKFIIPAQLLVLFRSQGHVQFEDCGIAYDRLKKEIDASSSQRDLFRTSAVLKKFVIQTLGPIALELSKQSSLRLACDQKTDALPPVKTLQEALCFQNLKIIFVLSPGDQGPILEAFDPSYPLSRIPANGYLIAYTSEAGILIDNPNDPLRGLTRNLGYVYGDTLKSAFHPLIHAKGSFL